VKNHGLPFNDGQTAKSHHYAQQDWQCHAREETAALIGGIGKHPAGVTLARQQ